MIRFGSCATECKAAKQKGGFGKPLSAPCLSLGNRLWCFPPFLSQTNSPILKAIFLSPSRGWKKPSLINRGGLQYQRPMSHDLHTTGLTR